MGLLEKNEVRYEKCALREQAGKAQSQTFTKRRIKSSWPLSPRRYLGIDFGWQMNFIQYRGINLINRGKSVMKFYGGRLKTGIRGIQSRMKDRFLPVKERGVSTLSQDIVDLNF